MSSDIEASGGHRLVLERIIGCSQAAAYDAFTQPRLLAAWFTTAAEADLRVGGRYANADGDKGEFLALEPPDRLSFTWENPHHCPGTVVTVWFVPDMDGGVRVRLEHAGLASEDDREAMREGWSWALDSLKSYLETGKPVPHAEWLVRRKLSLESESD